MTTTPEVEVSLAAVLGRPVLIQYQTHGDTILVDGYPIPLLEVGFEETRDGTLAHLSLDERFGVTIPKATLEEMAWWLANLVAVAQGQPCHAAYRQPLGRPLPGGSPGAFVGG